jgi:oligoribonuclease NrnB/cAMP/cGMP phosphodiesterase (DHH superfamily)
MKTGLSVLKTIIENNKGKIKKDLIRLSLQSLKMNTIFLDDEERDLFNKKIDKIYNTLSLKNIEGLLTEVNDYLQAETLKWGEEIGFNMPKIVKSFVEK